MGESQGAGTTDAAGGAGHEGGLPLEVEAGELVVVH
jgi:hypothetical protein